jgi:hypothetical protein
MGEAGFPGGLIGITANRLAPGDGAGNGIRTRDTKLGKLVLYQLSYARPTNMYNKIQGKSQGILLFMAGFTGLSLTPELLWSLPPPENYQSGSSNLAEAPIVLLNPGHRRSNMRTCQDAKKSGITTGLRFILLGVITLLWFSSMAQAQSGWPTPFQTTPRFHTDLVGKPFASRWWQTNFRSPLPPASAFALQTNLRKYLDTWPTPGATVSRYETPDEELTDDELM